MRVAGQLSNAVFMDRRNKLGTVALRQEEAAEWAYGTSEVVLVRLS